MVVRGLAVSRAAPPFGGAGSGFAAKHKTLIGKLDPIAALHGVVGKVGALFTPLLKDGHAFVRKVFVGVEKEDVIDLSQGLNGGGSGGSGIGGEGGY